MMNDEYLREEILQIKVGQEIRIYGRAFREVFRCGWPSIYNTSEQAFLSGMISSGCGVWRVRQDMEKDEYVVSKHEESDKRYYIDPDREHLFKRMEDGTLERNDSIYYEKE